MTTVAKRIAGSDAFETDSKVSFTRNGKTMNMLTNEKWYLTDNGKTLVIEQSSNSFGGVRKITMVFDKAVQ